jgi:hypothetical protein
MNESDGNSPKPKFKKYHEAYAYLRKPKEEQKPSHSFGQNDEKTIVIPQPYFTNSHIFKTL